MTTIPTSPQRGATFWIGAAIGLTVIGYGVAGLLHEQAATDPPGLALWFGGAGIAHDALVAPAAVAVGWLTRRIPNSARTPVRLGLAATVLLTLIVWPLVQGWGRSATLPSALPLDYGRNLIITVVALWAVVGAAIVVRVRRA